MILIGANVRFGWKADIALGAEARQLPTMWKAALTAILLLGGCSRSHKVAEQCVPLLSGWVKPDGKKPEFFTSATVRTEGGIIRWNGVQVDERTLASYLRQSTDDEPLPFIIFDPGKSDCAFAQRVRDIFDRNYACRDGACGQGAPGSF